MNIREFNSLRDRELEVFRAEIAEVFDERDRLEGLSEGQDKAISSLQAEVERLRAVIQCCEKDLGDAIRTITDLMAETGG